MPAPGPPPLPPESAAPGNAVLRFQRSMEIGIDQWRDGTGYDLAALDEATPAERPQIEALLLAKGIRDWRDVQALAALATPAARQLLTAALGSSNAAIEMAVLRYAPEVVPADERTASVVSALNSANLYEGLTQTLLEVEEFHPPPVIDALFRGVLQRDGATAGEFAAMLLFLHGQADSPLAWEHRALRLRLLDGDRRTLFRELCALVDVAPEPYISTVPAAR